MRLWLYTEHDDPLVDGPFETVAQLRTSYLWEWVGACLWTEYRTKHGWRYRHAVFTDKGWVVTSRGERPLPPFVPACVETREMRRLKAPAQFYI